MVMGLPFSGSVVVDSRKSMVELMKRIFKDLVMKPSFLTRFKIAKELKELVAGRNTSAEVLKDVKRLFIAFVWSTLLFPMTHFTLLLFLHLYLDNTQLISKFNYGLAVWRFVCQSMKMYNEKGAGVKHCESCLVGVMAWFFDRMPSLSALSEGPGMVRFGRWRGPTKKSLKRLQTIDYTAVAPFEKPRLDQPLSVCV